MQGLYIIFEGADGAGKTTGMDAVAKAIPWVLSSLGLTDPKINLTHHPGSTPLGKHIRKLVKHSEEIDPDIDMDPLSRQMLYMVDKVNFTKTILEPALNRGEWVFADRSNLISAIAYGSAEGVPMDQIQRLHSIIQHVKADRLYIFRCPTEIAMERVRLSRAGGRKDYFDDKSLDFFKKIADVYDNLLTGPSDRIMAVTRSVALENVKYIDSSAPLESVVAEVIKDLVTLLKSRVNYV